MPRFSVSLGSAFRRPLLVAVATTLLPVASVQAAGAVTGSTTAHQPAVSTAPAPTPEAAAAAAAATGKPIEIAPATTETTRLLVNPSGSYTYEQSTHPVRVRHGSTWGPVDTTLTRRADGTIAPNAAAAGIVFSGGGTAPMATINHRGVALSLTWDQPLPAPVLSGNTATYTDVLPGIDLQLTATADSFSDVLVVKTPQAAALPALRQLNFKTAVTGGSLKSDGNGGYTVRDAVGGLALRTPQPIMWDSAASSGAGTGSRTAPLAPSVPAPADHVAREGDHVAAMPTKLNGGNLSEAPDAAMLSQSKNFPLFVDPTVTATMTNYTMVNQTYPNQSYWFYGGYTIVDEGVGYNDTAGINLKRLLWTFDTSRVNGKHILSATFSAYETFSYSCTAAPIQLWLTGPISGSTTWANQPGWVKLQDSKTVAYGRSGCSPSGATVELNATDAVTSAASAAWPTTTLGLRAQNETNDLGWKRFNDNASLSVTYNTPPSTPSGLETARPSTTCNPNRGQTPLASPPQQLSAVVNDADGTAGGNLTATFQIWKYGSSTPFWTGTTAPAAPGSRVTINTPSTLDVTGVDWGWKVSASDATDHSAWTNYCMFYIDHTAPVAPTVTPAASNAYSYGNTVTFTLGNNGDSSTVGYWWSANRDTKQNYVTGTSPTVSLTLTDTGPVAVRAWGQDAATNVSPPTTYLINDVTGSAPRGNWHFDDNSGSTASDAPTITSPHTLSLTGGYGWLSSGHFGFGPNDPNNTDHAVTLDGASGAASTTGTVVRTDDNFTISAWVRPTDVTAAHAIVSQDTSAGSAVALSVLPSCPSGGSTAVFAMTVTTRTGSTGTVCSASTIPTVGSDWVHVVGSYDQADHTLTLWLGDASGYTETVSADSAVDSVASTGALRVGAELSASSATHYFAGAVDEVSVFQGTASPDELSTLQYG